MAGVKTRAQRRKQANDDTTAPSPLHQLEAPTRSKGSRTKATSVKDKAPVQTSEDATAQVATSSQEVEQNSEAPSSTSVVPNSEAPLSQEIIPSNEAPLSQEIIQSNEAPLSQEIIQSNEAPLSQEIIPSSEAHPPNSPLETSPGPSIDSSPGLRPVRQFFTRSLSPSPSPAPNVSQELPPTTISPSDHAAMTDALSSLLTTEREDSGALIHIWVNPSSEDRRALHPEALRDTAVVVPLSKIVAVFKLLTSPEVVLTQSSGTQTSDAEDTGVSPGKRKLPDDAEMPQPSSKPRLEGPEESTLKTASNLCEGILAQGTITPIKRPRRQLHGNLNMLKDNTQGKTPNRRKAKKQYNAQGQLIMEATCEGSDSDVIASLPKPHRQDRRSVPPTESHEVPTTEDADITGSGDESSHGSSPDSQESSSELALAKVNSDTDTDTETDTSTHDDTNTATIPEPTTPTRPSWGLGSLLTSARTVTRFLPGLGRPQPSIPIPLIAPATIATSRATRRKPSGRTSATIDGSPIKRSRKTSRKSSRNASRNTSAVNSRSSKSRSSVDNRSQTTSSAIPRDQSKQVAQHSTLNSASSAINDNGLMPKPVSSTPQAVSPNVVDNDQIPKAVQKQEAARSLNADAPRSKRKRAPSPEVIPNPPQGYGMVDEYFELTDSDMDTEVEEEGSSSKTPTPKATQPVQEYRWRKKPRMEIWGQQSSPSESSPSKQTPAPSPQYNNFPSNIIPAVAHPDDRGYIDPSDPSVRILEGGIKVAADFIGMVNPTQPNSFTVPGWGTDDSSIDDDDDDDDVTLTPSSPQPSAAAASVSGAGQKVPGTSNVFANSTNTKAPSTSGPSIIHGAPAKSSDGPSINHGAPVVASPLNGKTPSKSDNVNVGTASEQSQANGKTGDKPTNTWSQPPPPPPNPPHAMLPTASATADSERLSAARAKALQHAPQKPSRLRESSRISTSPAASITGAPLMGEGNSTSPAASITGAPLMGEGNIGQDVVNTGRKPLGEVSKVTPILHWLDTNETH